MDFRNNMKIPKLRFGKIKMDSVENIEELKAEYAKNEEDTGKIEKRNKPYEHTNYKTVKEFFTRSVELYAEI